LKNKKKYLKKFEKKNVEKIAMLIFIVCARFYQKKKRREKSKGNPS
jgi:hypothetical protein